MSACHALTKIGANPDPNPDPSPNSNPIRLALLTPTQVLCMAYMFIAPTLTLTLLTPTQVLCMAYMFIALAIVCDEYFVRYLVITPSSSYHP